MATSLTKSPQRSCRVRHLSISAAIVLCSIASSFTLLRSFDSSIVNLGRSFSQTTSPACPIIVYNKQIKTGSTVIANVLYRTTEAHGCYNSGCNLQRLLMKGNTSHIAARNGLTMTCHAQEMNKNIVPNLRATYGKEFIYIASVREPIGWFKSAACFFYRQKVDHSIEEWTDARYKKAIDWLLKPEEYEPYESFLFLSLGLDPKNTKPEILDKLIQYDLIIDNAEITEGLEELGKLLRWKLLEPNHAKPTTYRGSLYDSYRVQEIRTRTSRVQLLYQAATEMREARYERPAFAVEQKRSNL